jgi:hypothetical protein
LRAGDAKEFEMVVVKFPLRSASLIVRTRNSRGTDRALSPDLAALAEARSATIVSEPSAVSEALAHHAAQPHTRLLFGHYPMRMARELVGFSVPRMAAEFHLTKTEWMRIEANMLPLSAEMVRKIETFVRRKFAEACG